jgi:hypothetical protein
LSEAGVTGCELGSKRMANNIAITDDIKAVERWENEGGKVPPSTRLWTSLKSFRTERASHERRVIGSQKSFGLQRGNFSGFNFRRVV